MGNKYSKSMLVFWLIIFFLLPSASADNLSVGEYPVTNVSFEDTNSLTGSGWYEWTSDSYGTVEISTDSSKAYYGDNSIALYRDPAEDRGNSVVFQEISLAEDPNAGDVVEGGVWVMLDGDAASDSGGNVVVSVKYVVGSTATPITKSVGISNKTANQWYYILTETDELGNGRQIPSNAEKVQIAVDSWSKGTVYVDFAQMGLVGSITGNPSKLAIAEYHSWFSEPNYLPDPRRFTDPNYTGFADYNQHNWKHWEWGWQPDGGYNNDPGFYKQIGIRQGRKYSLYDSSFEEGTYENPGISDWRRYPEDANNCLVSTESYEGNYSVRFFNDNPGSDECSMWQWIPCEDLNDIELEPNDPHEKEQVYASAWIKFDNINDVNLGGGNFWIEVTARHDPDFNDNTPNDVNTLIAKSYEHISPEQVQNSLDGWIQLKTHPVNKAVLPWWTKGLQIAIRFYYGGTVYIDKVEIGEAEYSNVHRQVAATDTPKIGPYASTDDEVIDYHLDLCEAMQFDAMLINYYGHQFSQEAYQTLAFSKIADEVSSRDMKVCAFYEPKIHLKGWADVEYYEDMTDVNEMSSEDKNKVNNYIDDVTEYSTVDEISDINEVKHYIKMAAIQDDIKYILDEWGSGKCYLTRRGKAAIGIFGLYSAQADDGMTNDDWADIYDNLTQHDYSYDITFFGDTTAQTSSSWFDAFDGMMNWYLVDDTVRDRCRPTKQDIYERSRDDLNGRAVDWANAEDNRFAIGLTYPKFNDEGVAAWGPLVLTDANGDPILDENDNYIWRYYINRTMTWDGDFYRKNNQGLMEHIDDIDWVIVATFNDWNEGSIIEPSVENGYLYSILTQDMIEEFKGISNQPNDLMEQVTEKYIKTEMQMDVDDNIVKKAQDPAVKKTYYQLSVHQIDSNDNYLGELVLQSWSCTPGIITEDFTNHDPALAKYLPCVRISTETGKGWVKIDSINTDTWSEDFNDVSDWSENSGVVLTSNDGIGLIKDANDGCGDISWGSNAIDYISGDTITFDIDSVYSYGTDKFYSGAACLQMILDYEGFHTYTQDELHNYAVSQNELTDQNTVIDPTGMYKTLNHYEINSNYNFDYRKSTSINSIYDSICDWMSYDVVPSVFPRPKNMPTMIPLNGNYMNWVVINGYSSSDNPQTAESYTVNGFWITDPDVDGIGQDYYITALDLQDYYKPVNTDDSYDGYYVAVVEPSVIQAYVTIALPEKPENYSENNKGIISAARKGIKDYIRQKVDFKSAYKGAKAHKPVFVDDGRDGYYIVPFSKDGGCTVAAIINAYDGRFKQVSYTVCPDKKYLNYFQQKSKKTVSTKKLHKKAEPKVGRVAFRASAKTKNKFYPKLSLK
jgi:hypothetical protein